MENTSGSNIKQFKFLEELATNIGATETRITSPDKIVVEDRVVLKCKSGCHWYGEKFVCPPFTPSPEEFRAILKEYEYILVVKFKSEAQAEEGVGRSLLRNQFDPKVSSELKEQTNKFWEVWNKDKQSFLEKMLELEKAAFNQEHTLAIALVPGSCSLCKKCDIKGGSCSHPTMARYSEHALGVNVRKTLSNIGMTINFPFKKNPDAIGMLLID